MIYFFFKPQSIAFLSSGTVSLYAWVGSGAEKWALERREWPGCDRGDPIFLSFPTPLPGEGGYLRPSNPAGRFTRLRRLVSCGRSKWHLVSLGTEISYWYGSGRQGAPLLLSVPTGWACHSPKLCQLLGLAQAGSQSGYVFWTEVALT